MDALHGVLHLHLHHDDANHPQGHAPVPIRRQTTRQERPQSTITHTVDRHFISTNTSTWVSVNDGLTMTSVFYYSPNSKTMSAENLNRPRSSTTTAPKTTEKHESKSERMAAMRKEHMDLTHRLSTLERIGEGESTVHSQ